MFPGLKPSDQPLIDGLNKKVSQHESESVGGERVMELRRNLHSFQTSFILCFIH